MTNKLTWVLYLEEYFSVPGRMAKKKKKSVLLFSLFKSGNVYVFMTRIEPDRLNFY